MMMSKQASHGQRTVSVVKQSHVPCDSKRRQRPPQQHSLSHSHIYPSLLTSPLKHFLNHLFFLFTSQSSLLSVLFFHSVSNLSFYSQPLCLLYKVSTIVQATFFFKYKFDSPIISLSSHHIPFPTKSYIAWSKTHHACHRRTFSLAWNMFLLLPHLHTYTTQTCLTSSLQVSAQK